MHPSDPCAELIAGSLNQLWTFLKSNDGHFFFASIASARAIVYYCGQSPLPEVRHLAAVVLTALLLALLATASEAQFLKSAKEAVVCKSVGAKFATRRNADTQSEMGRTLHNDA